MNHYTKIILVFIIILYSIYYIRPILIKNTIPRITTRKKNIEKVRVFRTWKSREMNQKMIERCHKRWLDLNTNIRMEWFDDDDCIAFMKTQSSQIYDAYVTLKPTAFKADLFRLCILYENGGMYVDAQTMPYASIREMLRDCYSDKQKHTFVSILDPKASRAGIHNGFIFCTPKHPFIKQAIKNIVRNVREQNYTDHVLGVSGPLCLKRAINNVLNRHLDSDFSDGFNDFGDLSLYLYKLNWGPSQYVYKGDKLIMCKKHCFLTTFLAKMKKSAYERLWRNKNIFNKK